MLPKRLSLSVFAIAFWGIIGLALTGELNPIFIGLALVGTALAWAPHRQSRPPRVIFWNITVFTAIIVGLATIPRSSLLESVLVFFLLLQVAKLHTFRQVSDAGWIILVSLFHLIGTAVLTASLLFAVIFGIHVALTATALMAMTLTRTAKRTEDMSIVAARPLLPAGWGIAPASYAAPLAVQGFRLPRGFLTVTVGGVLLVSILFFPLIPRLSTQRLFDTFSSKPPTNSVSGFDEEIKFGDYTKISLNNEVSMYVRPLDSGPRPDFVRLRGVAVDTFDGTRWRRTESPLASIGQVNFQPFYLDRTRRNASFSILLQPNQSTHLFAPPFPEMLRLESNQNVMIEPQSGSVMLPGAPNKVYPYTVTCRLEDPENRLDPGTTLDTMYFRRASNRRQYPVSAVQEAMIRVMPRETARRAQRFLQNWNGPRRGQGNDPGQVPRTPVSWRGYIDKCLSLPQSLDTPKIRALAQDWTQGTGNSPYKMAVAIERRFKRDYQYSLDQLSRGNFIEDFLFRTKTGHCEYFATSMAVLLRTLGVPCRVVNGYYSREWNEIGSAFTVRQRDAHAWVEVYMGDSAGWMTFDPTPSDGVARPREQSAWVVGYQRFVDAIRVRWYRNVVDYSAMDQRGIVRAAVDLRRGFGGWLSRLFEGGSASNSESIFPWTLVSGAVAAIIGLITLIRTWPHIAVWWARRRLSKNARKTVVIFYQEILRRLERLGLQRDLGQTPREFAHAATARYPVLTDLPAVTDAYYAVRFAAADLSEDQAAALVRLRQLLGNLRRLEKTAAK